MYARYKRQRYGYRRRPSSLKDLERVILRKRMEKTLKDLMEEYGYNPPLKPKRP